jgi:hypothetical protein
MVLTSESALKQRPQTIRIVLNQSPVDGTTKQKLGGLKSQFKTVATVIRKPLGSGSTINPAKKRFAPRNQREQEAVDQAIRTPTKGVVLAFEMGDPRWPALKGWVKMQQVFKKQGEKDVCVHYVRNEKTGEIDDFKIAE